MIADDEILWHAPGGKRQAKPKGIKSVAQTRLDRIAHPSATYYSEWLLWTNRMDRKPGEYPTAQLIEDATEWLGPKIAAQKARLAFLQETAPLDGPQWEQAHEKLLKLEALYDAMQWTMDRRARQARLSGSKAMPAGTTSAAATRPQGPCVTYEESSDPFVSC